MRSFLLTFFLLFYSTSSWAGESILLYNVEREELLIAQDEKIQRPIASITKIMTAMVYLDYHQYLNTKIKLGTINKSNLPRQEWSRQDLLAAMLVRSDNNAAETLAADYPGGRKAFLEAMNHKAKSLKMHNTHFDDASGLSNKNVSTAKEVGMMLRAAMDYDFIKRASTKKQILLDSYYNKKIRTIELYNTNQHLLFEFDNIVISKTGFTTPAGWCVAMVVENGPVPYIVVVLGSKNKYSRNEAVKNILYNNLRDSDLSESADWQIYF